MIQDLEPLMTAFGTKMQAEGPPVRVRGKLALLRCRRTTPTSSPHLGTGAVMRFKPPAARSIGLEVDPVTLAASCSPSLRDLPAAVMVHP